LAAWLASLAWSYLMILLPQAHRPARSKKSS